MADSPQDNQPKGSGDQLIVMPPPIQSNFTCYGFHVWAEEFLVAARAYIPVAGNRTHVAEFLCCQSIELSLKSFLSLKGMSRKELKKNFGHELTELLKEAVNRGLSGFADILPDDPVLVKTADLWYDSQGGKRFQYFEVADVLRGFKGAPDLAALQRLAERLQSVKLRDAVLAA